MDNGEGGGRDGMGVWIDINLYRILLQLFLIRQYFKRLLLEYESKIFFKDFRLNMKAQHIHRITTLIFHTQS